MGEQKPVEPLSYMKMYFNGNYDFLNTKLGKHPGFVIVCFW